MNQKYRIVTLCIVFLFTLASIPHVLSAADEQPSELSLFLSKAVLGHAGHDFFTVSCRLTQDADVKLKANGKIHYPHTKHGMIHSFRVEGLKANTPYPYELTATAATNDAVETAGPFEVRTYPAPDNADFSIRFAVLGDSRNNASTWGRIASLVAKEKAAFMMHCGDFVGNGKNLNEWHSQVFGPAHDALTQVPFYPVYGNHERDAPILLQMWQTPGGGRNWHQSIGTLDIIGIDGLKGFEADSKEAQWLEEILSESKAKFILLMSHYPAWSSGRHGKVDENGVPKEKSMQKSRGVVVPLLEKYGATAFIGGHDHCYERSEREHLTLLTLGGAGAPSYPKVADAAKQNPYSVQYSTEKHYAMFDVSGETCTMTVFGVDGKTLDAREWKARKLIRP